MISEVRHLYAIEHVKEGDKESGENIYLHDSDVRRKYCTVCEKGKREVTDSVMLDFIGDKNKEMYIYFSFKEMKVGSLKCETHTLWLPFLEDVKEMW